ncbi:MAG: hypothetical protein ACK5AO_05235 [bacterium]|jgi:predicted GH43/DUF377 family glycosyl hydrolase
MNRNRFLKNLSLLSASPLLVNSGLASVSTAIATSEHKKQSFWDLFSTNYRNNLKLWNHNTGKNPVIPAGTRDWKKYWTANPAIIEFNGQTLLYYRGNGITSTNPDRHDRLAVAGIKKITATDIELVELTDSYIVDVGEKGSFDSSDALDPAAVVFNNKVYLYYSAIGVGKDSVGLAISNDGVKFEKYGKVCTGRAPTVVAANGKLYMIYQNDQGEGYKEFYLAESSDGINFTPTQEKPVFKGAESGWDKFIATPRIYKENDEFLMIYGGSPDLNDQPDYFGIARSKDMINWEKHPGNPVFGLGAKGEEDGGAIWFPALVDIKTHYVIFYEGSRGRYAWELSSQICMSSIRK